MGGISDKSSELEGTLLNLKPDIVCGTESWLRDVKPGCNPEKNFIRSSEVFPSGYKIKPIGTTVVPMKVVFSS